MSKTQHTTHNTNQREALRRQRERQAAAERRMKRIVTSAWIGGITVIVVLIGVMAWAVLGNRPAATTTSSSGSTVIAPAIATDTGALRFGTGPVTVSVYADFMCPYCGQFERANSDYLDQAVAAGTITLEIYPLSFLDEQSSGARFSTRAANALATVANADPSAALRFNQLVYANQPSEGSSGLTDEQLTAFATQAGASADVAASISRETYTPWVEQITQQAFGTGIKQTPTVKINGTEFTGNLFTAGALKAAIDEAGKSGQ
ncbi:DsbA family protein [Micropruina sp.]|uniref:DsbA family protein n=1 Tax=Micropruina sp. TaxID=2737536 RepID=UPI0039E53E53